MEHKWDPIPDDFRTRPCFKCSDKGCEWCHNEGTEYAQVFWTRKWMDRNEQSLLIRRQQVWLPRGGRSNARWEVTELHFSTLNVQEPDTVIEVVLQRCDRTTMWKEDTKYVSPEKLFRYYEPEDPLPDADLHITFGRVSGGENPCLICGKELKKGTHKFVVLDETCGCIIDPRFVPEKNGGLHPIGNDCAKQLGVELYLVR